MLRDPKTGHLLPGASLNPLGRPKGYRNALKEVIPDGGKELYTIMMDLARGKAYQPELADGRLGPVIVPTPDVRLRAAMELTHALNGRPVTQVELVQAELESRDVAAIRALDDSTLRDRAREALESGLRALDARAGQLGHVEQDAELVPREERISGLIIGTQTASQALLQEPSQRVTERGTEVAPSSETTKARDTKKID